MRGENFSMHDEYRGKIEKKCRALLLGERKESAEFRESPTYALSKMPMDERLFVLIYLETIIAVENHSEEYFDIDFIMALNEYLVRRTGLSVRMLNLWISGKKFRSLGDVTGYLNERYRTTAEFIKQNEIFCRRELKNASISYADLWKETVEVFRKTPEELQVYDENLGGIPFRENPVGFLLSLREEERLKYIALLAEVLYEHVNRDDAQNAADARKTSKEFVGEFGNLINTYVKYPEDPEIQTLLLTVRMSMNSEDFKDDVKRRSFFNDHLRLAAYYWKTNQRGARRAVVENWSEYREYFQYMPVDRSEPAVMDLYLDEAVLNIPAFQNDPLRFLHFQMSFEQCCHFLTMLEACKREADEAALAAAITTRFLKDASSETAADLDDFQGWKELTEEDRVYNIGQNIWDLVSIWRYNYKNCRKNVKANWAQYESACSKVVAKVVVPDSLKMFENLFEEDDGHMDPYRVLEKLPEERRGAFIAFCGALGGLNEKDAALSAQSILILMENPANKSASQVMERIDGWKQTGRAGLFGNLQEYFKRAAVAWKFNYRGRKEAAVFHADLYEKSLDDLSEHSRQQDSREEFKSYNTIMTDPSYVESPCDYLRRMSYAQCSRYLLFTAAIFDMKPEEAMAFAELITNVLFYPNDSIRNRVDLLLERVAAGDAERMENLNELLTGTAKAYSKERIDQLFARGWWEAYENAYLESQKRHKKNSWELNEKNVKKLFHFCHVDSQSGSRIVKSDPKTVTVDLLGGAQPQEVQFKKIHLNRERLFSDQTGEILRSMLGQLDIFYVRDERRGRAIFALDDLVYKRNPSGEQEIWTESESVLCQLLYMGIGLELLGPVRQERQKSGEVLLSLDLHEKGAGFIETATCFR